MYAWSARASSTSNTSNTSPANNPSVAVVADERIPRIVDRRPFLDYPETGAKNNKHGHLCDHACAAARSWL